MQPFNSARRSAITTVIGDALGALPQFAVAQAPAVPAVAAARGKTAILWFGRAARRSRTPGGMVDLIPVTHVDFDHFADVPVLGNTTVKMLPSNPGDKCEF